MKKVWNFIDELKVTRDAKNRLYIWSQIFLYAVIGAALWGIFGRIILSGVDWLLCFIGYPAIFIGFLGSLIYLYNNEFA